MELKILEEKNNELFDRKEIKSVVEAEITPSRKEILDVLAEKYKVPKENIKIKGIHGKFGSKTFAVEANIYSSKETREKVELKKKKEQESEKPEMSKEEISGEANNVNTKDNVNDDKSQVKAQQANELKSGE
jgi:ribosomal protein S24E